MGLVTDFDVRRVLASGKDIFSMTVQAVMNPKPDFVFQNEKAYRAVDALEMMEKREKPISLLPVLHRENKVVGIIHLHDIMALGL